MEAQYFNPTWIIIPGMWFADVPTLLAVGWGIVWWRLEPATVIPIAIGARILFDQTLFAIGHYQLKHFWGHTKWFKRSQAKAELILKQHQRLVILIYHFIFGMKLALPTALGASHSISSRRFLFLNAIGISIWVSVTLVIVMIISQQFHNFVTP